MNNYLNRPGTKVFRGVTGNKNDDDINFEIKRKLCINGNGAFTVTIPPQVVKDLNLYQGVIIRGDKDKLIITSIANSVEEGEGNE